MLQDLLSSYQLPALVSPDKAKELLSSTLYGYMPPPPDRMACQLIEEKKHDEYTYIRTYSLTITIGHQSFSFPFYFTYPSQKGNGQTIVYIKFRPDIDHQFPAETVAKRGFCVLYFGYQDVTKDNDDFTDGIAKLFFPDGHRKTFDPGKLMLWAWTAMRVLDAAELIPEIPTTAVSVAGFSRLGKSALLAGGFDKRFYAVYSNESGRCGAALHQNNKGEPLDHMRKVFPYWFCPHFNAQNWEIPANFDQHFLLSLIAPRKLYVASAAEDDWADPRNEFLCLLAAQEAWLSPDIHISDSVKHNDASVNQAAKNNKTSKDTIQMDKSFSNEKNERFFDGRLPREGDVYHGKYLAYHLRPGKHAFTDLDWEFMMDCLEHWGK